MKTQKERMLAEKLYIADDAELKKDMKRARKLTRLLNNTTEEQPEYRVQLIKELFGKTGEQVYLEPPFHCDYGQHIYVGENFFANFDCVILDVAEVKIGENVMFGPKVNLFTAGHPVDAEIRNSGLEYGHAIEIGDNVWVGGNTTVNPGVKIGSNVVIGSGSVVTKNIPDNVLAAGNPCKIIRAISETDRQYWKQQQDDYWQEIEAENKEK